MDAVALDRACTVVSPALPVERPCMAGPLQGLSDPAGRAFARCAALCRTEAGTGEADSRPQGRAVAVAQAGKYRIRDVRVSRQDRASSNAGRRRQGDIEDADVGMRNGNIARTSQKFASTSIAEILPADFHLRRQLSSNLPQQHSFQRMLHEPIDEARGLRLLRGLVRVVGIHKDIRVNRVYAAHPA